MSIVIIKGPPSSGKTTIANALRNNQIAQRKGALLVDETTVGEPRYLLEKILNGVALREGVAAKEQAWKPECSVVLVGDQAVAALDTFEQLAPGFRELHGPVYTITTGA